MLARLGLARAVLVQPSFYGTDNACMLDAMTQLEDARGVAVLPRHVSPIELDELNARGIRGLRVNVASGGAEAAATVYDDLAAAAATCTRHGWHVEIFASAGMMEALAPALIDLPVATVIDHFGFAPPGQSDAALDTMLRLLETGKVWVKLSGAYRVGPDPFSAKIDSLARRLHAANPERIVWGSDWPHTPRHDLRHQGVDIEVPFQDIDTVALLAVVPRWLDDDRAVTRVLVDNPARLYGFAAA
jgi:predicted TIM-barrel fold metal-dependent hydrolase